MCVCVSFTMNMLVYLCVIATPPLVLKIRAQQYIITMTNKTVATAKNAPACLIIHCTFTGRTKRPKKRMKLVRQIARTGLMRTRVTGAKVVTGDVIYFLNSHMHQVLPVEDG